MASISAEKSVVEDSHRPHADERLVSRNGNKRKPNGINIRLGETRLWHRSHNGSTFVLDMRKGSQQASSVADSLHSEVNEVRIREECQNGIVNTLDKKVLQQVLALLSLENFFEL